MLLFSGTSHPTLSKQVAECLEINLAKLSIQRFPDAEISVEIAENVRGQDTFVLQTIALDPNNYLVELLIIMDALKRASANSITAVIPYFGYCRQDRKEKPCEPITAKLMADMLVAAGATHILTVDLHSGQVEGFFDVPVDHVHAISILANAFEHVSNNFVVVAPDIGSVKLVHAYASCLKADFVVVDKHRRSPTEVEVVTIIGDVKGKDVLLADDMCSTGGTLVSAAKACREKGAKRIFAAVTHGLFVGDALEKIEKSPIEALFVSDTIPCSARLATHTSKVKVVSTANLLSHAIRGIAQRSVQD